MATATIIVKGMSCDGCVNSVTRALESVNGVQVADVDLRTEKAFITFDESKTNIAALKIAVEDAGYDVE
jgi:copper chaperone